MQIPALRLANRSARFFILHYVEIKEITIDYLVTNCSYQLLVALVLDCLITNNKRL